MIDYIMRAIIQAHGEPYYVGGRIRDKIFNIEPSSDYDIEVFGLHRHELVVILSKFGKCQIVTSDKLGHSPGVIKLGEYDFNIPRKETKTGNLHQDFRFIVDPFMPLAEAQSRRDFTINAVYQDIHGNFFDAHGGMKDAEDKILRHTSAKFSEDPLRVLRGMWLCGKYELIPSEELCNLASFISSDYQHIPAERVYAEWVKWADRSVLCSMGLEYLNECYWLELFPPIFNQMLTPYDTEINCYKATIQALDRFDVIQDLITDNFMRTVMRFAILLANSGRAKTTYLSNNQWFSPEYHKESAVLAESFFTQLKAPNLVINKVKELVLHHNLNHHPTHKTVKTLIANLKHNNITELLMVSLSIFGKQDYITRTKEIAEEVGIQRPLMQGRHFLALGYQAGPQVGKMMKEMWDLQLDGQFSTLRDGIKLFAEKNQIFISPEKLEEICNEVPKQNAF